MEKVYDFPSFRISEQLFHVPGAAFDGGHTSGGARILSPEPGGYGFLEIRPSLQVNEWQNPLSSWLMSKINGEVFKVRLAPTPQVVGSSVNQAGVPWDAQTIYPESPWSNHQNWQGDVAAFFTEEALEGTTTAVVDLSVVGQSLQPGHVIGHLATTYIVDEIEYDGNLATITVKPPWRAKISEGDNAYLRPYFTGSIANGSEIRASYRASDRGAIQLNRIVLVESRI